ncbi:MAG TPA: GNAT family N-acetyltransferase [Mycobacteriales bacterium]|nr:family N-acetyltransferase [Cryptosporangiaceae bacterium]MDQ1678609.1 ElaA protein [Actinomycetota bacterium]HEV7755610.1 GNAT family N-acetyltransferase [Mycobacteriales bacterium]
MIARSSDLDAATLYALLRLRVDVFVVEQRCPYPELDGADLAPGTLHLWTSDEAGPAAYLRILDDPDGSVRIGRVCTRADARGRGLAAGLVREALGKVRGRPVTLNAQTHLTGWYRKFGFVVSAPEFLDDGIPHTPMRYGG